MREQLEQRLEELKAESEAGQKILAELETRQIETRNTLIRISGAVQVLEEELAKAAAVAPATVTCRDEETNGVARLNGGDAKNRFALDPPA